MSAPGIEVLEIFAESSAEESARLVGAAWGDITAVSPGALGRVLTTQNPQPVCAVARIPAQRSSSEMLDRAVARRAPLLVLDRCNDPGNLGTIFRAAEAAGAAGLVLGPDSVDPYNPKVVRSSAGSLFRLPFGSDRCDRVVAIAGDRGVRSIATVVRGGVSHHDIGLAGAAVIVMGNEASGLGTSLIAACDERVTVEMSGEAESLNLAMAATVLAFESQRQRVAEGRPPRSERPEQAK